MYAKTSPSFQLKMADDFGMVLNAYIYKIVSYER
jgi:hypothetical protein